MSILGTIFSTVGNDIIKSLGGLFTSDDERNAAKNEMIRILQDGESAARQAILNAEKERTRRLELDMTSDSWLSKNVRPMTLIFLLVVVSMLALFDGNIVWDDYSFTVQEEYITLYNQLLLLVCAFYFGSRGFEKVQSNKLRVEKESAKKDAGAKLKESKAEASNVSDFDLDGGDEW